MRVENTAYIATLARSSLFFEGHDSVVVSLRGGYCGLGVENQIKTDPEERTPAVNSSNTLSWFQEISRYTYVVTKWVSKK